MYMNKWTVSHANSFVFIMPLQQKKAFIANRAILLDESHKLDSWPLDEVEGIKSGKSKLNVHGTILEENQLVWTKKRSSKGKLMIWRTKMQPRVHVGSNSRIQFQMSQNWFLWNLDIGPTFNELKVLNNN